MRLAEDLKRLRRGRGRSQEQLAEHAGSNLPHSNRIETGKYNPSHDVVQWLARALDLTIDYFLHLITQQTVTANTV